MGGLTIFDIYNNWNAQAINFQIDALISGYNFQNIFALTAVAGGAASLNNAITTSDVIGLVIQIFNTTDAATIVSGFRFAFRDY
jgi:hypothetical protein